MTNPFTDIKVEPLLQAAERREKELHREQEAKKQRCLRGGNSGAIGVNGEQFGSCARVALLRFMGIDAPSGDDSTYYFNAGHQNEDRWLEQLRVAWGGKVKAEEEVPIAWEVTAPDGTKVPVTGRPDVVLCDDADVPQLGIELKKVCSSYRAVNVFLAVKPDTKHLVQAAHYSLKMGKLPWLLAYSSDSSYDTPGYAFKKFNTKERKLKPGRQLFYLGWQGDTFCFVHPVTGRVVQTAITGAGIEKFYSRVLEMEASKKLGARPTRQSSYSDDQDMDPCTYCVFAESCDQYDADRDYEQWVDRAKVISEEGK